MYQTLQPVADALLQMHQTLLGFEGGPKPIVPLNQAQRKEAFEYYQGLLASYDLTHLMAQMSHWDYCTSMSHIPARTC